MLVASHSSETERHWRQTLVRVYRRSLTPKIPHYHCRQGRTGFPSLIVRALMVIDGQSTMITAAWSHTRQSLCAPEDTYTAQRPLSQTVSLEIRSFHHFALMSVHDCSGFLWWKTRRFLSLLCGIRITGLKGLWLQIFTSRLRRQSWTE